MQSGSVVMGGRLGKRETSMGSYKSSGELGGVRKSKEGGECTRGGFKGRVQYWKCGGTTFRAPASASSSSSSVLTRTSSRSCFSASTWVLKEEDGSLRVGNSK